MIGRKEDKKKNIKRVAIGSSIAAVAGYVAGILTAPKSGQETRNDLKASASSAEKELKKLHTDLADAIEDTKKSGDKLSKKAQAELDDLVNKARDTKEKARELISVIHEGGIADDKDLKKAIKDASAAIDQIRDQLKKK